MGRSFKQARKAKQNKDHGWNSTNTPYHVVDKSKFIVILINYLLWMWITVRLKRKWIVWKVLQAIEYL